jgi:hypothetical protein
MNMVIYMIWRPAAIEPELPHGPEFKLTAPLFG